MKSQRHLFSFPSDTHYLNCAYMAPVSNQVAHIAQQTINRLQIPSRLQQSDFFERSDNVRALFSRLIGINEPNRIAIVPSVSYAMSTLAQNTPLRRNQNVVVTHNQFPSNVYAWKRLCERVGAELRVVHPPPTLHNRGLGWNDRLGEAIDDNTAVVAIPELHWIDGTRFNLKQIGILARAVGARFIIDGTQSVGALPFNIDEYQPDAVVCAGYKWLMGPYSIGLAYFGPLYDNGTPIEDTWITRVGSDNFSQLVHYNETYRPGAIRYDMGERSNFILLPMLEAGISQVNTWGPKAVQGYCRAIGSEYIEQLRNLGCFVEDETHRAAHLFGVRLPAGFDIDAMSTSLAKQNVSVSIRANVIRVSPHVYNNADDFAALVTAVRAVLSSD